MKTEFDNAGDNVYFCNQSVWPELNVTVDLHKWTSADREALMALCNDVDRTFLSDRLPYPYTEADADWWLGMVAENDGKEGVWRAIVVDGQLVGSISVEKTADEQRNAGSIGYMILTPFWTQGIGTEAVRQICGIAFRELALERIIGEVFPENLASARVLEKNGFQLERTKIGGVVKDGKAMDVKIFVHFGRKI
jgi:RimJ/RimL family protein N-acetyltransferase